MSPHGANVSTRMCDGISRNGGGSPSAASLRALCVPPRHIFSMRSCAAALPSRSNACARAVKNTVRWWWRRCAQHTVIALTLQRHRHRIFCFSRSHSNGRVMHNESAPHTHTHTQHSLDRTADQPRVYARCVREEKIHIYMYTRSAAADILFCTIVKWINAFYKTLPQLCDVALRRARLVGHFFFVIHYLPSAVYTNILLLVYLYIILRVDKGGKVGVAKQRNRNNFWL